MHEQVTEKSRFGLKALIVAGISLALLIPVLMLQVVLKERQELAKGVQEEIAKSAGGRLKLAGPVLAIPVTEEKANGSIVEHTAIVLPASLSLEAATRCDQRTRGIYAATVFEADVAMKARFHVETLAIHRLWSGVTTIHLSQARLVLELPDPRALRALPVAHSSAGNEIALKTGVAPLRLSPSAVEGEIVLGSGPLAGGDFSVSIDFVCGGGSSFGVWPLASEVDIELSSNWPSPSFTGDNSPIERNLDDAGFSARWRQAAGTGRWPTVLDAEANHYSLGFDEDTLLGVEFFDPVGIYHKSERALKYAILFIIVPFIAILLFELFTRRRLHPIQYALVGIADVVFYALLMSLSEHIGFTAAYLSSGLAVIALIVFYASSILGSVKRGFALAPILALLYGYLYSALQSRDYALLTGSIGIFIILAAIMVLTRKVNWYKPGEIIQG